MSVGKAVKTIVFTAAAQDNHNSIKVKNVLRWLKAGSEVRVQINGKADRMKAMENIVKQIEKDSRAGAVMLQKVIKPEMIKFYLKPTKDAANIMIEESQSVNADNLDDIIAGKDLLSEEFEKELDKSIGLDYGKLKKK